MSKQVQRQILPIPYQVADSPATYDAKDPDTAFPPIEPLLPPEGAPNVLIVLVDDCGFGASSAFGGPIATPAFERLAGDGLRYTRFHTTALCSPTRAALLAGRNHHSVGMGGITEIATSAPGYSSLRPNDCAPLAETLKLNGYCTAQFGKCHEVPVWQTSPLGPFDNWPSGGGGFEHFYGFIGGETNQYAPALYENTTPVEPDKTPEEGYHLTEDMTDHAISWIRQQKALMPDKPFFTYFAPGATHAPHHVPVEWSEKYRGQFDQGWDVLREETFARQQELGVVPESAELTARHDEIPAWDEMPEELKPVLARQMEVYAGFLEHTDHHVGRLIDALEDLEILDDTLVYVIIGDNGASAEGDIEGCFNELMNLNGAAALQTTEFMISRIDDFGTPAAYNHYAVGWAHAMNTPYQWTKQVASHWGGTRNGTIVHWPTGHRGEGRDPPPVPPRHRRGPDGARGGRDPGADVRPRRPAAALRGRRHGLLLRRRRPPPTGTPRSTSRCSSTAASTTRAGRRSPGTRSRGSHGAALPPYDDDVWELYGPDDWTQAHDLAAENPEQLAHLQQKFLLEGSKYKVFPLDDRRIERFNPDLAGRPTLLRGNSQVLFEGMGRLTENVVLNIKNKSHAVTADISVPDTGANGVIVAQGGAFGGWSLYLLEGRPAYCYNLFGIQRFHVRADQPVPVGRPPGPAGVRLRRRRTRQGRHGRPVRRRHPGRQRTGRRDGADALLR